MLLLHLKRILFFGLLGLICATAWILLSKPVYEAQTTILVGAPEHQLDPSMPPEIAGILNQADSQLTATEIDILRQPSIFALALRKVSDQHNDQSLVDPKNFKNLYKMFTVTGGPTQPDQNPMTISSLAVVSVRAYDPQLAIDLSTAVSQVYTDERRKKVVDANSRAEKNLKDQMAYYETLLNGDGKTPGLDAKYASEKEKAGVTDIGMSTKETEDLLAQLEIKRDALESDLHGSELELNRLRQEFKGITPTMKGTESVVRNPEIQVIEERLTLAKQELAAKLRVYQPGAREVQQIQDQVDSLQNDLANAHRDLMHKQESVTQPNQVNQSIKTDIVNVSARVDSLRAQLSDVNQQVAAQKAKESKLPQAERAINKVARDKELTELKYKSILAAYNSVENRIKDSRDPAVVMTYPDPQFVKDPVEPNVPRTILVGLLAGLSLGAIFTAARESIKPVVFSATQLEQATGLPVVATMPKLPGGELQRVRTLMNSSRFPRKNFHDMASVVLAERESLPKTIVVCGVDGDSSSSQAAISYAAALARAGLRVTLVDANPAKVITRSFDMEADNGIVDYLTQAALVSQKAMAQFSMLTKQIDQIGCKVCAYGTADVTTLTDFSDDRVAGIIEALKPDSDVLIIETAPSGRQPDAVRMARHADEVLATFESGTSSDRSVDTLRDLFADAGVKKMSMVLTSTLERVV